MPDVLSVQLTLVLSMVVFMMSHLTSRARDIRICQRMWHQLLQSPLSSDLREVIKQSKQGSGGLHLLHNITFLASDHATKLFSKIFPDSAIAKKFSCSRTKITTIVKKALAPHFTQRVIESMSSGPFSLMMDESNDRRDKSCIILVRLLDPSQSLMLILNEVFPY